MPASLINWDQLFKDRIFSSRSRFFPLRVDPFLEQLCRLDRKSQTASGRKWWCTHTPREEYCHETHGQCLAWGGRVVRWSWVNFQCLGVLLIWWIIVGQGPTVLAVGAGGGCLDIFSLICHCSFLSPSLWETARYRLKYCLKGLLSITQPTNQPTNQY